ncbi:MAG: radical SAM protein [Candidatus Brocadiia bacterium]
MSHRGRWRMLDWIVTLDCPARCFYCFQDRPRHMGSPARIPPNLVESVRTLGFSRVVVSGGEPLIVAGMLSQILQLLEAGIAVNLLTRDEIPVAAAEKLFSFPGFTLEQGIDSLSSETAMRIGCPLPSEQYLRLLAGLTRQGPAKTIVRIVCVRDNAEDLPSTVTRLRECGISNLVFILPRTAAKTDLATRYLAPDKITAISQLAADLLSSGVRVRVETHDIPQQSKRPSAVCNAGRTSLTLFPSGDIGLCQHLPEIIVGQIGPVPYIDEEAISPFTSPGLEAFEGTLCNDCTEFDRCQESGRCYASSSRLGALFGPDEYCPFRNRQHGDLHR